MDSASDLIIIGGSLTGCLAAKQAAQRGLDVTVLEEHAVVGKQGKCTAIVSASGLPTLGVDYKPSIVHSVRGAFVHAPNATMTVRAKDTKAYVLDRDAFDRQVAREAQDAGARIELSQPALKIQPGRVQTPKGIRTARALIGADGVRSHTAAQLKFPPIPGEAHALCWEAEYDRARVDDASMVHVFLDREQCPGFFGWMVPCGADRVRVGLGVTDFSRLNTAKDWLAARPAVAEALRVKREIRSFNAMIPLEVRTRTQDLTPPAPTLLVGDAAGQTKATTGGGWVFGGACAQIAADSLAAFVKEGRPVDYEHAWRARYGNTLSMHRRARSFLDSRSNRSLDLLVSGARTLGGESILAWLGDMDYIATPLSRR